MVTRYRDEAEGVMEQARRRRDVGEPGHPAARRSTYEGRAARRPPSATSMHHEAHEMCFIANSVKTEIVVEEVVAA